MFEDAGHFFMYASGAAVSYAESPDTLADDLQTVKPMTGLSVPRVYERIFDNMRTQASESPLKKRVFDTSITYPAVRPSGYRGTDLQRKVRCALLVYASAKDG